MCPAGRRWLNEAGHWVAHVLAIETPADGIVLVDTGIGREATADPVPWLGGAFLRACRPVLDPTRSAHQQLLDRGLDPTEVRHVVLTHLDVDHAGGLADFPGATVHVHTDELDAAVNPRTAGESQRYRRRQWAHGPHWQTYRTADGEPWHGFAAARPLATGAADPEGQIVILGLPGHTRGHVAVAVDGDAGWIVHAGDAYFHTAAVHADAVGAGAGRPRRGGPSRLTTLFEKAVAVDRSALQVNHERLAELARAGDVTVVCAHDPSELAALVARS